MDVPCSICGHLIRPSNVTGVCQTTVECRRAYHQLADKPKPLKTVQNAELLASIFRLIPGMKGEVAMEIAIKMDPRMVKDTLARFCRVMERAQKAQERHCTDGVKRRGRPPLFHGSQEGTTTTQDHPGAIQ